MFYQIAFECYSIRWSVRMQIVLAWPQVSINPHHELTDELKEENFIGKRPTFLFIECKYCWPPHDVLMSNFTVFMLINIFYGSKVKLTLFNFIYNRPTGDCTFTCSHFAHFSNLHITIHSEIRDNIQGDTNVPASDPRSRDPLVHTTVIGRVHLGRPSNVRKWLKVTLTKALYHVERI